MASGSTESESNRVAGDLAGAKNRAQVIGDHIAQWRVARGMTMASLGRAVGVSYQTIQKIEVGNYRISVELLEKISDALKVSTSRLLKR
ncbi:MAG: helix-turn-helix transcriptional regulator [Rhizobiaceae bacterium]|nr:helix-turn-helix transcriptional regulator [Rhizobiaceae bacterium]